MDINVVELWVVPGGHFVRTKLAAPVAAAKWAEAASNVMVAVGHFWWTETSESLSLLRPSLFFRFSSLSCVILAFRLVLCFFANHLVVAWKKSPRHLLLSRSHSLSSLRVRIPATFEGWYLFLLILYKRFSLFPRHHLWRAFWVNRGKKTSVCLCIASLYTVLCMPQKKITPCVKYGKCTKCGYERVCIYARLAHAGAFLLAVAAFLIISNMFHLVVPHQFWPFYPISLNNADEDCRRFQKREDPNESEKIQPYYSYPT